MITLEQLITRIEQRLMMAAGLDVQIHAEDALVEMIRTKYEMLFDDFWWDEYLTLETFTLDGTTGIVTTDLSTKILHFRDINAIYYNNDSRPMPRLSAGNNPTKIRTRSHAPTNVATSVFKVFPSTLTGQVHVWYRTRIAPAAWEAQDPNMQINMDAELLVLGVAFDYLSSDGSNIDDAKKLGGMYAERLKQMRDGMWEAPISKKSQTNTGDHYGVGGASGGWTTPPADEPLLTWDDE